MTNLPGPAIHIVSTVDVCAGDAGYLSFDECVSFRTFSLQFGRILKVISIGLCKVLLCVLGDVGRVGACVLALFSGINACELTASGRHVLQNIQEMSHFMSECADADGSHLQGVFAGAEISKVSRVGVDNDFELQLVECVDQSAVDAAFQSRDTAGG